jgi:hypothetical protein
VPAMLTAVILDKAAAAYGTATAGTATAGTAAAGQGGLAGDANEGGLLGQTAPQVAAHPVLATAMAGVLVLGAAAGAVTLTGRVSPRPAPVAQAPQPAPITVPAPGRPAGAVSGGAASGGAASAAVSGALRTGPASLEAANATGRYVTAAGGLGVLTQVSAGNTVTARGQASFQVVAGLSDVRCFSFRAADGRYLRHADWRLRLGAADGTALFRGDATFCPGPGQDAASVTLESANYPGWFLRHRGDELWVDQFDGTAASRADGSFRVRPALA